MPVKKTFRQRIKSFIFGGRSFKDRLLLVLFPALALSFTLFFFGPLDLSYVSRNYVDYTAIDILPYAAVLFGVVFAILLLIGSVPGGEVHEFIVSLYAGMALAVYSQGAFLNPDFGALDGHAINWPGFSRMMLINTLVWFLILLIPHLIHYFSNKKWQLFVRLLSVTLILMQCGSLGLKLFDEFHTQRESQQAYVMLTDDMLNLGNQKNTIVFLLDHVSNKDLDEAERIYPGILDPFTDFTRFDNANSHYTKTVPSIVNLLTSEEWNCDEEKYKDYFDRAWNSENAKNFYDTLHKNNFDINIFAFAVEIVSDLSSLSGIADNIKLYDQEKYLLPKSFQNLIELSLYRYMPIALKPFFVIYTADIATMFSADNVFYNQWDFVTKFNSDRLHYGDFDNSFRFYYLQGSHSPYYLDELGQYSVDHSVKTNQSEQLAGFMRLIGKYIDQLKEMRLYDSAEIIIIADHGSSPNLRQNDANNNFSTADFQPILLIKQPDEEHNDLILSHAPVTIQDVFFPTILQGMGLEMMNSGISAYDVPESEPVERWTRFYATDDRYPEADVNKVNVMREYRYEGDGDSLLEKCREGDYEIFPMLDSYY